MSCRDPRHFHKVVYVGHGLIPEHMARKPIDFRKGIPSLCALVVETFSQPPQKGLFIFYNQARNKLKLLGWHRNGFMLVHKVLEKGKFFVCNRPG